MNDQKNIIPPIVTQTSPTVPDTLVSFLVDSSGSMVSIQQKTLISLEEFFQDFETNPINAVWSIDTFPKNSNLETQNFVTFDELNYKNFLNSYVASGNTPLFDSVANTISRIKQYKSTHPNIQKVIFIIVTDGSENASIEYANKSHEISSIISELQNHPENPWQFIFIGANMNAWSSGFDSNVYTNSYNISTSTTDHLPSAYKTANALLRSRVESSTNTVGDTVLDH